MDPLDGLALPSVAVHAGRTDLTDLGVHAVPIDLSTTAPLPDVSEARDILDELIEGKPLPHGASTIYRRAWNPTVAAAWRIRPISSPTSRRPSIG